MTPLTTDDIDQRLDVVKRAFVEDIDDLTKIVVTAFNDIGRQLDDIRDRLETLEQTMKKLD
jgi:hypothetical protein